MPAAVFVMLIIIVLNIFLLIAVMRLGTQGEHHSELSADQSSAVVALRSRLGQAQPAPKAEATVQEHAKDVEVTAEALAEEPDNIAESVANSEVTPKDESEDDE